MHSLRQAFLDAGDRLVHRIGDAGGARLLGLGDVEAHGVAAVVESERALLGGAVAHVGDLAEADDPVAAMAQHELCKIFRPFQAAAQTDRLLGEVAVDPPYRRRQVLRLHRRDDIGHGEPGGREIGRPYVDRNFAVHVPRHLHLGDAGQAAELAGDAGIGQQGQLGRRHAVGGQHERHDRQVVGIEFPQQRLFHLRRQVVADAREGVTHVLARLVGVLAEDELDGDQREAIQ